MIIRELTLTFHNGSESHVLLPLWNEAGTARPS